MQVIAHICHLNFERNNLPALNIKCSRGERERLHVPKIKEKTTQDAAISARGVPVNLAA